VVSAWRPPSLCTYAIDLLPLIQIQSNFCFLRAASNSNLNFNPWVELNEIQKFQIDPNPDGYVTPVSEVF
jgi:hypothetical protein